MIVRMCAAMQLLSALFVVAQRVSLAPLAKVLPLLAPPRCTHSPFLAEVHGARCLLSAFVVLSLRVARSSVHRWRGGAEKQQAGLQQCAWDVAADRLTGKRDDGQTGTQAGIGRREGRNKSRNKY